MYTSASAATGDQAGIWEGSDFACLTIKSVCDRAFGPAETLLIDQIKRHDFVGALASLDRLPASPPLPVNINAKQGQPSSRLYLRLAVAVLREPARR